MAGRTRTNLSAAPVYDDFIPQWERKEEPGANILIIHLPGFAKEQIGVTYVDSSRTLKVQGEKPLDKNRRSRFNQAFPVPQNSIIEKIQGSFRNGILTITIPKQTVTQVSPVKDAKETEPPKAISQQKPPTKDQKETPPPPPPKAASTSNSKTPSPQTPQKAITDPKSPKGPQTAPSKSAPSPTTRGGEREKQANGKKVEPPKQPEETQKKVAPPATTAAKQTEEKAENVEKKAESSAAGLKNLVQEKEKKDSPMPESNLPKVPEKEKKLDEKAKEEKKGNEGGGFMAKAKEIKGMESIIKTVKRLGTDDYEERQLLLNIGVSVLVIVALGAYITYTYRSSGKPKD
ncbi:hypothetical protein CCACVL1_24354 [Corchorus capsularis]|uniref:SHSP domain-containing protein n=1 Tax=Corchorus capsularis TaxID=210143 RepID=A0A1R3GQ14_COCAP|nr:hypothetical protein CCACVL1_24354 [Corchorus capsularis]